MTKINKMHARVLAELGYDLENIRRTYTGRNMKASGAWSWISNIKGSNLEVGSPESISSLLTSKKLRTEKGWSGGQMEILPG